MSEGSVLLEEMESRGWLQDVLDCVERIDKREFALEDVYAFGGALARRHPRNNNIKAKIRQQLQILRDAGVLEFLGEGQYRKAGELEEYLFYTEEGSTFSPGGAEVENLQILGFYRGVTRAQALRLLLQDNDWIAKAGYDPDKIRCKRVTGA